LYITQNVHDFKLESSNEFKQGSLTWKKFHLASGELLHPYTTSSTWSYPIFLPQSQHYMYEDQLKTFLLLWNETDGSVYTN